MYPRRGSTWSVVATGVDASGLAFECAALLHDISEGGIFMRIACCVKEGSRIHARLSPPTGPRDGSVRREVSVSGAVLRTYPQPLGTCDVAIEFMRPLTWGS